MKISFLGALTAALISFSLVCQTGCDTNSGTIVLEEEVPRDPSLNESFYGDEVYSDKLNDSGN
ncbi:hypothetical protein [Rhodopirellula bahusiensis]|uniref:hypothetical protein n=1 Tax=Rhodopirellula bahusiensis TaxID=2014065 RepID=UPI0032678FA0